MPRLLLRLDWQPRPQLQACPRRPEAFLRKGE